MYVISPWTVASVCGADRAEGRSTISVVSCLVQRVVVLLFSRDRERAVLVIVLV